MGDGDAVFEGEVDATADEGVAAEGEVVGHRQGVERVGIGFFGWQGVAPALNVGKYWLMQWFVDEGGDDARDIGVDTLVGCLPVVVAVSWCHLRDEQASMRWRAHRRFFVFPRQP